MPKNKTFEDYLKNNPKYTGQLEKLRTLILSTELKETIKWGAPVYTFKGKNILGLAAFKNHFGIWFFNGVFLKDELNLLINAQENKTKALRQMRFKNHVDIEDSIILNYINEAINNQKLGKEIKPQRKTEPNKVPLLLKELFSKNVKLESSFKKLSPGKQREYYDYISEAKRESTKNSRSNKIVPMILEGKGLYDKYKNC